MDKVRLTQPGPLGEHGQAMWNKIRADIQTGILEKVDAFVLYSTCQWWDTFQQWSTMQADENQMVSYKATCMAGTAYKHFMAGAVGFGLTPKSRKELNYDPEEAGTDVFSTWMKDRMKIDQVKKK